MNLPVLPAASDPRGSCVLDDAPMPWPARLRSYALEARCEFLRVLREPTFAVPTLLFPPLFYLLFGVFMNRSAGGEAARYLLATYGVFGVISAGLFGFGVTIAMDREQGFLKLKRALPMPPGALLLAKLVMAMLFATLISLILAAISVGLGGVRLAPTQWMSLLVINIVGMLPFCALGLYLGTVFGGNAAPAVINVLFLPMSFLSGLWIPLTMLPALLGRIAVLWPAYHLGQIALKVVGFDQGQPLWMHVLVLAAMTAAFLGLAYRRLARDA